MERKKTNKNKTITRKSRTQGRLGPYLSMRARRLQIYARRQIFQNHSLRPSPFTIPCALPPKPFWRSKRERQPPTGGVTIITRAGRFLRKRHRKKERASERKNGSCEDTSNGRSGAGSRNIFENLNRLLETTGPARRRVRIDTEGEEAEGSKLEGGDGGSERRRDRTFSRGYSRQIPARDKGVRREEVYMRIINRMMVANDSPFLSRRAVPYMRLRVLHVRACATIGQVGRNLRGPSWRSSLRAALVFRSSLKTADS